MGDELKFDIDSKTSAVILFDTSQQPYRVIITKKESGGPIEHVPAQSVPIHWKDLKAIIAKGEKYSSSLSPGPKMTPFEQHMRDEELGR